MAKARLSGKSASCCQYKASVMAPSVKPLFQKYTILAFIALVKLTAEKLAFIDRTVFVLDFIVTLIWPDNLI